MDPSLKRAGKFIKGSGVDDPFIECGLYGPKSFGSSVNETLSEEGIEGFVSFQKSLSELNCEDSY